ncbi:hypothetical protein BDF20DRAFT_911332 [Mycotypha africana]|uniref:uncharacterized protein n=1 Tax=Mycotypha africana TaxID=64632 RepID=UPI002300F4ED|nr:uncharacterized protein BDF20DRAFT_911332 [Mycotypha africana]KAI8984192.1 hypothetical protein BDF20DRAFT_911332 [Mycotypha africana]
MSSDSNVTENSPKASEKTGSRAEDFKALTKRYAESCSEMLDHSKGPYKHLKSELTNFLPEETLKKFDNLVQEQKCKYKADLLDIASSVSEGLGDRLSVLDDMVEEAKEHDRVKAQLIPSPSQVNRGVIYKQKQELIKQMQHTYLKEADEGRQIYKQIKALKQQTDSKKQRIETIANYYDEYVRTAQEISGIVAALTHDKK